MKVSRIAYCPKCCKETYQLYVDNDYECKTCKRFEKRDYEK